MVGNHVCVFQDFSHVSYAKLVGRILTIPFASSRPRRDLHAYMQLMGTGGGESSEKLEKTMNFEVKK